MKSIDWVSVWDVCCCCWCCAQQTEIASVQQQSSFNLHSLKATLSIAFSLSFRVLKTQFYCPCSIDRNRKKLRKFKEESDESTQATDNSHSRTKLSTAQFRLLYRKSSSSSGSSGNCNFTAALELDGSIKIKTQIKKSKCFGGTTQE